MNHDPLPDLRKILCPVLVLVGEKDQLHPPKENLKRIIQTLKEGNSKDHTVQELLGLNQLLQTCRTGHPSEYNEIEETVAPAALERIGEWILNRFGQGIATSVRK